MKIFATHGLPSEISSDNAQNLVSEEMRDFFYNNRIKHRRVTPYQLRANGLVENFNKSLTKCVKTAVAANKNWRTELFKFLLNYRTTAHVSTGQAPATLLYNHVVKNKLPHLEPRKRNRELKKRDSKQKQKMKYYADQRMSKHEMHYRLGQNVLILKGNRGKLSAKWDSDIYTVVGQKGSQVKLKNIDNYIIYRHISHVRPFYGK